MTEKMPWLKEYKVFGIPETLAPYPEKSVGDILDDCAKKFKKTGLIQNNFKMTYPEVKDHVDRLAAGLAAMGLEKGDRVATILPTSIQFVIADYAIAKAGLVQIPSSSLEPPSTLEHKFSKGTPKAIICLDEYVDIAKPVMEKTGIQKLIVTTLDDYSLNPPASHGTIDVPGGVWMADLIANNPPEPPKINFDLEKDLELLLFTGGTTGLPKGCMLTHRNIYANSMQSCWAQGAAHKVLQGAISVLLGLPLFHSYGHMIMHLWTMLGVNQILITDARDTKVMVDMIKAYRPLMQMGVPTQFLKIAQEELAGIGMLGVSGSAPLPPSTQEKFEKQSSGAIMEGYGLSEMSPCTHLNTSFLLRLAGGRIPQRLNSAALNFPGVSFLVNRGARIIGSKTVGSIAGSFISFTVKRTGKPKTKKKPSIEKRGTSGIPFPDTEVLLIDVDTGEALTTQDIIDGKRGEMCLKGPQRMLGYWPDPGTGLDEDGYVRTGDVVMVDKDGYFYIVDRTKDMVNVSGYKVYTREIDDILSANPDVELGATVGIPDPEREGSERVIAYVQPVESKIGSLQPDDIIQYLKERVAKYAVPKAVKIVEAMPLTEVQKLDKKKIRKMAEEEFTDKL
ncbi:MAG: class I adenylate-forming enzyme family protein [Thermodesulfobacteriota bacterium]|nr:class I adenylate-forming enzyme family protein [Thermodesulfobacteriota bacterium]